MHGICSVVHFLWWRTVLCTVYSFVFNNFWYWIDRSKLLKRNIDNRHSYDLTETESMLSFVHSFINYPSNNILYISDITLCCSERDVWIFLTGIKFSINRKRNSHLRFCWLSFYSNSWATVTAFYVFYWIRLLLNWKDQATEMSNRTLLFCSNLSVL